MIRARQAPALPRNKIREPQRNHMNHRKENDPPTLHPPLRFGKFLPRRKARQTACAPPLLPLAVVGMNYRKADVGKWKIFLTSGH